MKTRFAGPKKQCYREGNEIINDERLLYLNINSAIQSMRLILLLLVLLLLSWCTVLGQIRVSTDLGINISYLQKRTSGYYYDVRQIPKSGINAAINIDGFFSKSFFIETGIRLITVGAKYEYTSRQILVLPPGQSFSPTINMHKYIFSYLQFPLLFKYSVFDEKSVLNHLTFGIGPSISNMIKSEYCINGNKHPEIQSGFARWDFALNFDLSYRLKRFMVGVMYYHGLKNIKAYGRDPEFTNPGALNLGKNQAFLLHIGYPLNK